MGETPAEMPTVPGVPEAYRAGYKDGASDVARSLGYQVVEETPPRIPFGLIVAALLVSTFAYIIYKNSAPFPRVERNA